MAASSTETAEQEAAWSATLAEHRVGMTALAITVKAHVATVTPDEDDQAW